MVSGKDFNADRDIPSLAGKVVLVTGGTAGLGSLSIHKLANHGASHIYFTGRNSTAASALISSIQKTLPTANITFMPLDLSSLASIAEGVQNFTHDRLDIVMCNAGVMAIPGALSKDGYEIQFATNHLGHAALIKHLLPIMLKTADLPGSDVRIVLNTSLGWRGHPSGGVQFDRLNTVQPFPVLGTWIRYGQSKLANIVYAAELARRYPTITSVSIHPGVINTGLIGNLGFLQRSFVHVTTIGSKVAPEQGVLNQTWAAAGATREEIVNGAFYLPVGIESNSTLDQVAKSEKFATELWEWTEKALDIKKVDV